MSLDFLQPLTGFFAMPAAENPTVAMIEAAYRHYGLNGCYINREVAPDALGDAIRGARPTGWRGLNCSTPHLSRSSQPRCLQRHGISRLPNVEGDDDRLFLQGQDR